MWRLRPASQPCARPGCCSGAAPSEEQIGSNKKADICHVCAKAGYTQAQLHPRTGAVPLPCSSGSMTICFLAPALRGSCLCSRVGSTLQSTQSLHRAMQAANTPCTRSGQPAADSPAHAPWPCPFQTPGQGDASCCLLTGADGPLHSMADEQAVSLPLARADP